MANCCASFGQDYTFIETCECCVIQSIIELTGTSQTITNSSTNIREVHNVVIKDSAGVVYMADSLVIDNSVVTIELASGMDGLSAYITGCEGEITYNFEVEMIWDNLIRPAGTPFSVTNKQTFIEWMTDGLDQYEENTNAITIESCTDFIKVEKLIKCNLFGTGTTLNLSNAEMGQIISLGDITGLIMYDFHGNKFELVGYEISEAWANKLPNVTSGETISFQNNPYSVSGTNLETILISKGYSVLT